MSILRIIGSLLAVHLAWPALLAQSEEHPFIKSFDLTVLDGRIHLAWTMAAGSTCDGSDVERSSDGVNWSAIHRIEGICGDPLLDVPYTFMDAEVPEFSTVHYRIRLGFAGYSSVRTAVFKQLIDSDLRFYPSPMRDTATLLLNVPGSARVDLLIFDMNGRVVLEEQGLLGREHTIHLPYAAPGSYAFVATADGRRFQGRFVKH
jgi:hypothetical protein